jgi:hypothetical protein
MQVPLFVGLISMFVGSTLQDDIATITRRLLIKGHDILGMVPSMNLERLLHEKTCPQPMGKFQTTNAAVSATPPNPKIALRLITPERKP